MGASGYRRALWQHKLADEVVRGLVNKVRSETLSPGTRLGTRESIAAEFVTTPHVVDRALDLAEAQGLILHQAGSDVVVATPPLSDGGFSLDMATDAPLSDIVSILELRIGVETESAALAADRHSPQDLASIQSAAEAFAEAGRQGTGIGQADYALHRAIALASGNPYVRDLLDYLGPLLIPRMRIALPKRDGVDENLARSLVEHQALVTAIAERDAPGARAAMRGHLQRSIDLIQGAVANSPRP